MGKKSIIIIGAGPGGLAAAIGLAGQGCDVHVVEKGEYPGGRMGRVGDEDYTIDTGPSILQLPQVLDGIFTDAGKRREDYITLAKVEPYTELTFWDGSVLECSSDPAKMIQALEKLKPGLGNRFLRWSRQHEDKATIAYERFIAYGADSALKYFNPVRMLPTLRFKPWQTLYTHLMEFFEDERVSYAFSYPSKYLGLHPTTCSSVFSVIPYLEYAHGVWYPMGGFREMALGMKRCAEDLGATFSMNTAASQIIVRNGRAVGVELEDGRQLWSDAVVCNADFSWANTHLLDVRHRRKYTNQKLNRMKYSCSTFMLYLGLDKLYDRPHHTIYLSDNVRRTDRAYLNDESLDRVDPPFYVCNPCVTDPSGAPEGHSTLYVLVPCPNTLYPVDWDEASKSFRDLTLKRLALLGFDDVESHIQYEKVYTAETWEDDYNVFKGAVFNLAHTWGQLGPMRPHCASEDVNELYWVGGGTHPGSGLLTIFESARIVTDKLA